MDTFRIRIQVGNISGRNWETFDVVVDTGSTYSSFPGPQLRQLGIFPIERRDDMAKGLQVSYEIGQAQLRLQGRQWIVPVTFEEPEAIPVIGATALEIFGLGIDSNRRRQVPVTAYQ